MAKEEKIKLYRYGNNFLCYELITVNNIVTHQEITINLGNEVKLCGEIINELSGKKLDEKYKEQLYEYHDNGTIMPSLKEFIAQKTGTKDENEKDKKENRKSHNGIYIDRILDDFLFRYVHNQIKIFETRERRKLTDSEIFYFDEGVRKAKEVLVPLVKAYDKYFYEEVLDEKGDK